MRRIGQGATAAIAPIVSVASAACSRGPTPTTTTTPTAAAAPSSVLPNDIRWFRTSAEYRALAEQTYAIAGDRLSDLSNGLARGSWGVIMDADETALDNSEYQRRLAGQHAQYSDATWAAWVNERAAMAIPGAARFTKRVHDAGGRVVIVTNRSESLCNATRANLRTAEIATDLVMCQLPGVGDKNPRFQAVQNGTAAPGFPKLTIVAWVGDNILDFPMLTQATRNSPAALAEFGRRYFILPNPMYGSWQQNREP